MASRKDFLRAVWKEVIDAPMTEHWIDNAIRTAEKTPNAPFGTVGITVKRLLELGATRRDLSCLNRFAAYEAIFSVLYMLEDPGLDPNDSAMLHESLLKADPSGREGRAE